jgi:hypothetical protein
LFLLLAVAVLMGVLGVVTRLLLAGFVPLAAWWVHREMREMD